MNAWQRFWQRHSSRLRLRLRRQLRFRLAARRFFRPRSEPLEPRLVLAAPVATGDSYSTPLGNNIFCDSTLKVDAAHGVLLNDFDPDGDLLTASLVTAPAPFSGSLT